MLYSTFRLAVREISRNILRSALTTLGIVIGVATIIALVSIGKGVQVDVQEQISALGENLLILVPGGNRSRSAQPFDYADVEAIRRFVPELSATSPAGTAGVRAVEGNRSWSVSVNGVEPSYFDFRNWEIEEGRLFDAAEARAGQMLCVIGSTVREELFGAKDPIEETIRLNKIPCRVIGTLQSKGQAGFGGDQDSSVFVPFRSFQRRFAGSRDVTSIHMSVQKGLVSSEIAEKVKDVMRDRRNIADGEDDDFKVHDMAEVAETVGDTTAMLTSLVAAIAGVSLLVGGIGIMNIMLVSVTERTREIGIRLAIGAFEREVLAQFLMEAVVLSLLGGLLGVALGLGVTWFVTDWIDVRFVADPLVVLGALGFSAAVGVVFGYFPARRAAHLDPIDALRFE